MKLRNSTDFPDYFLRRMVGWCAKQLGYSTARLRAEFRNRREWFSGHAYGGGRIVVSVSRTEFAEPIKGRRHIAGVQVVYHDRMEALIGVTAHEIAHLCQYRDRRHKFAEHDAEWHAQRVLDAFRLGRDAWLAAWNEPPAEKPAKPKLSIAERRAEKAQADLDRWQRKLKLAQTKVKKLKRRVAYYDKRQAAHSAESH